MTHTHSPSSVAKPTHMATFFPTGPAATPAPPRGAASIVPQTAVLLPSPFLPSISEDRSTLSLLSPTSALLDLHDNRLNGTVSPSFLSNCTNLKLLYLAGNDFSGEIPPEISSPKGLLRLDLSDNNIAGDIPDEVSRLSELLTLRLQNNALSGHIPDLSAAMPNLTELNMTNNEFYGRLPNSMIKGSAKPASPATKVYAVATPLPTVPSNPSSFPETSVIARPGSQPRKGLSPGAIVAIVVANCVALLVVTSFVVAHCCARGRGSNSNSMVGSSEKRKSGSSYGSEKKVYASGYGGDSDGTSGTDRSKLVFLIGGVRNRGPGRIPLDWTTRVSLVLGAARGLARIHAEYSAAKVPHGNVKSSNVLLDKNGVACISDFGLSLLLNPVHAIARLGGYRAPEQGELLLYSTLPQLVLVWIEEEQGVDLPKWVRSVVKEEWTAEVFDQELLRYKNIDEELVAMLHVGLACVVPQPEKRPTMAEVVKMIEDIRVEQSPLGEDYDESRNSLSPSLPTTEDGLA
ncbi:Protein kinase domain [Sesbania bispinosa]|nr:Protein kinase domain [Sesbania bispinosa]